MAKAYDTDDLKSDHELIAHIRPDKKEQLLLTHLTETSQLAEGFAAKVGLAKVGKVLGLLHDFGKASKEFQDYLHSAAGLRDPDEDDYVDFEAMKGKIDHSTAGAQVVFDMLQSGGQKEKIAAQVLALCIASHHSGLIDCLTPDGENNFQRRMDKPDGVVHKTEAQSKLPKIDVEIKNLISSTFVDELFSKLKSLQNGQSDSKETAVFKVGLLICFLLSCLIDADRLNTADFESPGNFDVRNYGNYRPWDVLIQRLDEKLKKLEAIADSNRVDQLRHQVSLACLEYSHKARGIYQLTVPTGGGKTWQVYGLH